MKVLYVIHTSPKRIDFVNEYMLPCFERYGIRNIEVWNDEKMQGQLNAWTECAWWIALNKGDYDGVWHLEDDVVPCKKFKEISEALAKQDIIVQGFTTNCRFTGFKGRTGIVPLDDLPYGMQCFYVPQRFLKGYLYFIDKYVKTKLYKSRQYDCGTLYSDNVFKGYLKRFYPNIIVNILENCMVEHIDYLIGGRSVKGEKTDRRACRFDNYEEVERLKEWIKEVDYGKTKNRD